MNKELLARFEQLSQDEQDILLALSAIYVPIGQTRFQQLLKAFACVPTKVVNIVAKPLREKLVDLGLMELTSLGWVCNYSIADTLLKKAAEKPAFLECLSRMVFSDTTFSIPKGYHFEYYIRMLRIYLYQKKEVEFLNYLEKICRTDARYLIKILQQLFFLNFDKHWFEDLPFTIQMTVLRNYLMLNSLNIDNHNMPYRLLKECFEQVKNPSKLVVHQYVELHLIRGDINGLDTLLEEDSTALGCVLIGTLRVLQNKNEQALNYFDTAIKQIKKETRKRNIYFSGFMGYFYNLALLRSQTEENLQTLRKQLQFSIKQGNTQNGFYLAEQRLLKGLDIYQAKTKARAEVNYILFKYNDAPYDLLFYMLLLYWLGEIDEQIQKDPSIVKKLNQFCQQADEHGYFWYAAVSSNLLKKLLASNKTSKEIAHKYRESPFNALVNLLPHVEPWQRALDALTKLASQDNAKNSTASKQKNARMVWVVALTDRGAVLAPREQRLGKSGRWSNGRPVAIKRLHKNPEEFDYLTDHDKRICSRIKIGYEEDYYSYYHKEVYQLNEQAVAEAIGHPHLYWGDARYFGSPLNISTAELQLLVSEQKNQLLIKLIPAPKNNESYIFERTANDDIQVYKVEPQHHQVAATLGEKGLLVPKKAKQQVIDSISSIASMLTVQSDIGGQSSHAETVPADHRLHIHLQPMGEGIQIDIFVQPFSDSGPVYKPGIGGSTVLAEIDGKQLQTTRDLAQEKKYLEQVLDNCPGLYRTINAKWILDDAEMALEALLQLQALDDFTILEWPKGKAIKVSRETGLSQTQFSVRKEKDWFSISGEIKVDDDRVMEVQSLIGLLAATPGRFLKLEDGQVIALTQELRQRLDDLSGLGQAHGESLRFHPLAAQALDDITEGMNVKAGKHWQEQLKKLSELDDLNPQLPTTLQGELRDYQLQGYQWMIRLAHLGAGACLADDMGLGKTIQALAMILSRAADGPTLILAPTSVCNNWLEEAQHFAPTLNVRYFGNSSSRQQQLDNAGPFDLVVCSYGLLQTQAEKLVEKQWHTIVADEAQAIKNPQTQRSQAAMSLQGNFKIITTGTPIENHLGELWNLFNFINPGLLGSLKQFNERYAQKIENQRDHATQKRLKKLLQPFILRRLKNDVLTELPARTEVTLHVELSAEERTLYEALRRNAMQTIADSQAQATPPGQQHLKVLAEIMKLRRVCCNPRLVLAESDISSAKLQVFEELVEELISNHHKALVFSQFVSHLALIKELLDNKGIHYQYLDGATSMPKRKAAVNAFQSGQGDLFLISLKAGGAGLNLTAADYVVHMDPWWNPAVEDQASDRAHRMGQKRPVTIYRLVAKDTIEDKIVDLHKHKRDLANSLLKDGDISSKMSVKDMLELIGDLEEEN